MSEVPGYILKQAKSGDGSYWVNLNTGETAKSERDVYRAVVRSELPRAILEHYRETPGGQLSVDEIKALARAYGSEMDDAAAEKRLRDRKMTSALTRTLGSLLGAGTFGGFGAMMSPDVTGVSRGVSGSIGGLIGALLGYGITNAYDGDINRHNRMEAEMGVPIDDRTYKYAQAKMTEEDLKAFRDIVAQHKENARQRELRQKNRFERNRKDRVSEAKLMMMTLLGVGGVTLGGAAGGAVAGGAGKFLGGVLGGVGGLVGGNYAGKWLGNRTADRMERVENDTGVRVNEQNVENSTNLARQAIMYNMLSKARSGDGRGLVF